MEPKHFESLYPEESRYEEIDKILSLIKKGSSCQLVGVPGTGKSNLLGLLTYNRNVRIRHLGENQKWFHFVYMDFSEVKNRSLADVIKFMTISLSYSFQERGLVKDADRVRGFLSEVENLTDEMILFQALKKAIDYFAIERELTIVFLFDRFDQYAPRVSADFFSNLKIMRNRAKYRFACVFGLNRELTQIVEPASLEDFYEFVAENIVYLKLFDAPGITFRLSYLEKVTGKKIGPNVKEEILKLTGGHGKLTRLASEAALSEGKIGEDLSAFLLAKKAVRGGLFEITRTLLPQEVRDLKAEIKNEFLENVGLAKNGKCIIPLFITYLNSLPQSAEKLSYDSEKNEITKGGENLSDKLTPSEFRLLRFLITNSGKVCEKDEIIENVWKDSKTKEGVTDQALDQIIYRLRKKIEDDPENPQFLQTIKGRGYKLTE